MLKMAVFAPIPSARVKIATVMNPGFFLSVRAPYRISCQRFSMEIRFRKNQAPPVLRFSEAESVSQGSEPDMSPHLQNTRIVGTCDLPESRTDILSVVIKILKLSMVEEVERIETKLESDAFTVQRRGFRQG
jgi:hypothetical protein